MSCSIRRYPIEREESRGQLDTSDRGLVRESCTLADKDDEEPTSEAGPG